MIHKTTIVISMLMILFLNGAGQSKINQNFYGWFYDQKSDISLGLSPPNLFRLTKTEVIGFDHFIEHEISSGTFEKVKTELRLTEKRTGKRMSLYILNDEILVAKTVKNLKANDRLFIGTKYYNSGQKQYQGRWKDLKKVGSWQYWDEKGSEKYYINFKNGIPVDTVKPPKN